MSERINLLAFPLEIRKYYYENNILVLHGIVKRGFVAKKLIVHRQDKAYDIWQEKGGQWKLISTQLPVEIDMDKIEVMKFHYPSAKTDTNPYILVLGEYDNPNTGKNLLGGINFNALAPDQVERLLSNLEVIFSVETLKERFDQCSFLFPDIVDVGYRTYTESDIESQQMFNLSDVKDELMG